MVRFLFLLLVILSSCSKIDDLPIDKIEDNPIFSVQMMINGDSLNLGAGLQDYFMFAQSDTIGSLRINKGLLAPSVDSSPHLHSAFAINFIGQDIRSGEFVLPETREMELFNSDTIPFWQLSLQASLFGNLPSTNMKLFIDDEEYDYSSETPYLVQQKEVNRVTLVKDVAGKNYYYTVNVKEEGLKSFGSENLHIYFEGENSSNSRIFVNANFEILSTMITFPDGLKYDFESSISIDQLGEYKLVAYNSVTETVIEANFFIEKDETQKWVSSRINFTGSKEYLGMIEALNTAYIEFYDAKGKYFNSILRSSQPASSYFRISKVEPFLPNLDDQPTDKISFSTQLILQSEDEETILFSGSGIMALGN